MDNTDYKSYKPRSLIFTWENDAFSHITEARKWEAAFKANAHKNHQDEKMQALLNVDIEKNKGKFWRPWHKFDDLDSVLRLATDQEYKNVLRELIRGEVVLPLETEQKKKIQLEKKQKKQEKQSGSWIKLEEPADEINCVKVGDTKEKEKQYIKQKGQDVCRKFGRYGEM